METLFPSHESGVIQGETFLGKPAMSAYLRAVPVLQVANVETSARWYCEVLGFTSDPFPKSPPYSFAILRREDAEIMLQCAETSGTSKRIPASEFVWSVYLRVAGTGVLDVASVVGRSTRLLRGPERMFYGLVEFEVCDPDGYRVCVSGDAPADADVKLHVE